MPQPHSNWNAAHALSTKKIAALATVTVERTLYFLTASFITCAMVSTSPLMRESTVTPNTLESKSRLWTSGYVRPHSQLLMVWRDT